VGIEHLLPIRPVKPSEKYGGDAHPMRAVTHSIAFDGEWEEERSAFIRKIFDDLAPDWTATRNNPERSLPLLDALERGAVSGNTALELGSGTGLMSGHLREHFSHVISIDLSMEMLRNSPREVSLINADAARLPIRDGAVDVLLLMNMFLFAEEVSRCLAPKGFLIWISSRAEDTPIHLSAAQVHNAITKFDGHEWVGTASRIEQGAWCVLQRV